MGSIMNIIMGPTLFVVLLVLVITGGNQLEAAVVENPLGNSSVPTNGTEGIANNITETSLSFDPLMTNMSRPDESDAHFTVLVENNNGSLVNISGDTGSNSNNTQDSKVILQQVSVTPGHKKPCPIPNSNRTSVPKESRAGNHGNGTDSSAIGSAATVKEENHETALEKISESIAGALDTFKNSFKAIFSGSGIRHEELDCYINETLPAGGEKNETKGGSGSENGTVLLPPEGEGKENLHQNKTEEATTVLTPPMSSNDTIITANNTNVTNATMSTTEGTTTTTPLPVVPDVSSTTAAPEAGKQ